MANFKLNISDSIGKSAARELKEDSANALLGMRIGNKINASIIKLTGQLKITGGSDKSGVPMRIDVGGPVKKYILLSNGVGLHNTRKGLRIRKLIRGNTITEEIYQINCKFDGKFETTYIKNQ